MNLFRRRRELRQLYIDGEGFLQGLADGNAITIEKACEIPTVAASLAWIIHRFAMLPVRLLQDVDGGETIELHGDRRTWLLNNGTPADTLTGYDSRAAFARDYLLRGSAYMHISRDEYGSVEGIRYVKKEDVAPMHNFDPIWRTCRYIIGAGTYLDFDLVACHRGSRDGATGLGILAEHALPLTTMHVALEYERRMAATGGMKKGFLTAKNRLSRESFEELKTAWSKLMDNSTENNGTVVLNEGVDYHETAMSAYDTRLSELKAENAHQIAEMFGLSSAILGGTASPEQIANAFRGAVEPICAPFIAAVNKNLLTEAEKAAGKRFAFDTDAILGGDLLSRYQAYEIALKNHFMQVDEVRYRESLPPIGFDFITLGLQDTLYNPKTGKMYVPNTKETVDLTKGGEKLES